MGIDKITSIYAPLLSPGPLAPDRSSRGLHICAHFLNNNKTSCCLVRALGLDLSWLGQKQMMRLICDKYLDQQTCCLVSSSVVIQDFCGRWWCWSEKPDLWGSVSRFWRLQRSQVTSCCVCCSWAPGKWTSGSERWSSELQSCPEIWWREWQWGCRQRCQFWGWFVHLEPNESVLEAVVKVFLSILKDFLHSGVKFQTIPFLVRCMSGIMISE